MKRCKRTRKADDRSSKVIDIEQRPKDRLHIAFDKVKRAVNPKEASYA